jgi:ribosomal protein L37AE/L43A
MSDEEFLNGQSENPKYFKCIGSIMRLSYVPGKQLYYTACTECKKKVNPNESAPGWWCEKCSKVYPDCNPTYNFSVCIGDFTSSVYA